MKVHKDADDWEYFAKNVQIDGQVYDFLANIRKKPDGEYVYSMRLKENKKKAPALPFRYNNHLHENRKTRPFLV